MNELKTSVVINLKGDLDRKARRMQQSVNRFSRNGRRDLKSLNARYREHGSVVAGMAKHYSAAATAAALLVAGKGVIDFDAQLTRMQTDGKATAEQIKALKQEMFDIANDPNIRVDVDDLLTGFSKTVGSGVPFEEAKKHLRTLGTFIQATGTDAETTGSLIAQSYDNGLRSAVDVAEAMEVRMKQALTGAVPIRESGKVEKGVVAPLAAVIGAGSDTIKEGGALMQIAIKATKSAEEAQTSIAAYLSAIQRTDVQEKITGAGIKIKGANGKIRPPSELIPEIYQAAKGDGGVLGELFGDAGVRVFQGYGLPGSPELYKSLLNMQASGQLQKDARINASTAKAAMQSLKTKTESGADSLFSQPTKDLANAMDSWQRNDLLTNLLGVNYALGAVIKKPFEDLWTLNKWAGQKTWSGVSGLFGNSDDNAGFKGEVKITIDQDNQARVTGVNSNNRNVDIDVDTGTQMVNP